MAHDETRALWRAIEKEIAPQCARIDELVDANQEKVLRAFQAVNLSDAHLFGSTGYGYSDRGREQLDHVFARSLGAERAIVRASIASGTHALSIAFFGLLRPGDELLYATGEPYDTLAPVIGLRGEGMGSLREFGVAFRTVSLSESGKLDLARILAAVTPQTKVIAFQRSAGYAWRRALSIAELKEAFAAIRRAHPDIRLLVDNCYGEFTEENEPTDVGADVIVGSLIKNPGGGIAPTGGYIAGTHAAIETISYRVTAPGIGAEAGSYENYRLFFQGLYLAPHVVGQALKGSVFAAALLQKNGYLCEPSADLLPRDLVLKIRLETPGRLLAFCRAIQANSPIDAHVKPEPWAMPGYEDPVIMAAGAFVQGASLELSADGPLRPPYTVYLQGGLTYSHVKLAVTAAVKAMSCENLT
ncbi:aminotransferase class I/II-fold pyridoxal phosphate-dependent enzyme [Ferroacidibacillus organovorans]|uniref:Aluminum resistance family protein n=1 Tax=Ferroacidibacillus organovorans TaxID=1765683 RepID=A0A101XSN4_9BACL|nr:methionine gamma-lyase family protein [Ferroacidibacillus organovorans]KUO96808.1 hypothetical protein ATW55_08335 [Ferroacidibacillus organovorans]